MACSGIPAPGIPSDWSDLTGYINTSQCRSFLSLRKIACGMHACEIEESTITSLCSHIGALRKEQKTCLVNLACRKDVLQSC